MITLPTPPSTNKLFIQGRHRRARSKAYDDWRGNAGWVLRLQRPEPVHGPVIVITGVERMSANADIDNRLKAVLDLLVAHRIIDGDQHVNGIATSWLPPGEGVCRIIIIPAVPPLSVHFNMGWHLELETNDGD